MAPCDVAGFSSVRECNVGVSNRDQASVVEAVEEVSRPLDCSSSACDCSLLRCVPIPLAVKVPFRSVMTSRGDRGLVVVGDEPVLAFVRVVR